MSCPCHSNIRQPDTFLDRFAVAAEQAQAGDGDAGKLQPFRALCMLKNRTATRLTETLLRLSLAISIGTSCLARICATRPPIQCSG